MLDAGKALDVFELVELTADVARVRSPFLFELGELLSVRVEDGGAPRDLTARVRAHVGTDDDKITELALERP